jgi:hypothetical protein
MYWTRPEQSKEFGPSAPHRYGLPACWDASETIFSPRLSAVADTLSGRVGAPSTDARTGADPDADDGVPVTAAGVPPAPAGALAVTVLVASAGLMLPVSVASAGADKPVSATVPVAAAATAARADRRRRLDLVTAGAARWRPRPERILSVDSEHA